MGNLACTYSKLGMYRDALVLHQKVLALYRRVLPGDHPDIGMTRLCGSCLDVTRWCKLLRRRHVQCQHGVR